MRSLVPALVLARLGADHAHALHLCARIDKMTGDPRDGSSIRFRVECRAGEASFGTAADLAMIRQNRANLEEHRADIDTNSEAIAAAHVGAEPARIAAVGPASAAPTTAGCGLTVTAGNAVFNLCNVHVRSGEGATWGTGNPLIGTENGLGNLIVGYDEENGNQEKTGSHNLIVGPYHSYPVHGGLLAGFQNAASGRYSSVSGGVNNTASGQWSAISGGSENQAVANRSSISGGIENTTLGQWASVSGGRSNTVSNSYASISGGLDNFAGGQYSSVLGGADNTVSAAWASISGGFDNRGSANYSSVSGGLGNTASGSYSSVSGGETNTARNTATSILGGTQNIAGKEPTCVCEPMVEEFCGIRATISGGSGNLVTGDSSILGGANQSTSAFFATIPPIP